MDEIWFGSGVEDEVLEACLEALALEDSRNPLLAVVADTEAPRILLASRGFFDLFGVGSSQDLAARLLEGNDPGARRLGKLCRLLNVDGAPHLERLRFFLGPGTEVITFLCRRTLIGGEPVFVAAALGVRPNLLQGNAEPIEGARTIGLLSPPEPDSAPPVAEHFDVVEADVAAPEPDIRALRAHWPSQRSVRFLWQCDAAFVCTSITPPLAEIVGDANADLVGRDLTIIAPQLDPSGRLGEALAGKTTWSGINVDWPISDAPAAVAAGLGALAVGTPDQGFGGYRGYGVLYLDRLKTLAAAQRLDAPRAEVEAARPVRSLSPEEHDRFAEIGGSLRGDMTLRGDTTLRGVMEAPATAPHSAEAERKRQDDIARHGLAILDRLSLGLLVNRDAVPIFANRCLLDTLGYADEDALHNAGGIPHLFGGMPGLTGGEPIQLRHADGRMVPANVRMQTVDWDGLPTTLLTLQFNPPRVAESGVDTRELQAILDTATDGVAVIGGDGMILSLNRSGEALFGCDRSDVIGRPFVSLFAPHNQTLAADYLDGLASDAMKRLLNDGREFLVNTPKGGTIPVFMTLGRIGAADHGALDGKAARFCAIFRDLTHWKKVERDLEDAKIEAQRADSLKSEFLAKVSHEIRTPLNAIIGFAETMLEERSGPIGNERYRGYLRDIVASGQHVSSLVNDLLDLSKIEAGKMDLSIDAIDANKVIRECVGIMQPQAARARIIMRLSLAPNLPQIKADARSLRQIVLNLLSNAVKFNEPGGQVIVATASPESGHVVIRIRDTGRGMSETEIAAAFEPFRQLPNADGTEGTGLGLPLTKALVEANQAALSIRSRPDQGTLVEVAFPPARVLTS